MQRMDVAPEEGAALFKAMLAEKDIAPLAPWDNELPKFINDPRYSAVKQLKDRRDLFDEYCKDAIRAIRAAKKAAQDAGERTDVDPATGYRALLLSAVTSTRTHFSDFKRSHGKDARFRAFGKTEGEREKVFRGWLRELGERKRVEAERAERAFRDMLREDPVGIREGDKWAEVKLRHATDARYSAVPSSSLRESLFTQFLAALRTSSFPAGPPSTSTAAAPGKPDKAARAAASLRDREAQVRAEKERVGRSALAARGALGREESEREFRSLLIDAVRDHEARWDVTAPTLESDPRFSSSTLTQHDLRRLFDAHLASLYAKRVSAVEALFLAHAPALTTPFSVVLPAIATSPAVVRLVGEDYERLEGVYGAWTRKRETAAKDEFEQLMKESPVLEHWGRLQKKEEGDDGKKVLDADEGEEDGEDGALDLKMMANQVDLKAIHAVLKHDKRYTVWDHDPQARDKWIQDFVANLSAPKLTVHQRE